MWGKGRLSFVQTGYLSTCQRGAFVSLVKAFFLFDHLDKFGALRLTLPHPKVLPQSGYDGVFFGLC